MVINGTIRNKTLMSDDSVERESSDSQSAEKENEGRQDSPCDDIQNDPEILTMPPWRNVQNYPAKWKRDVNLLINGFSVNQLSLYTLRANIRIDDAVINAFIAILSNQYPGGPLAFDIYFMTALKQQIEHSMEYYLLANNVKAWTHDYWLVLMNVGEVHWTLLLISFRHHCFVYFDPLHNQPDASTLPRLSFH